MKPIRIIRSFHLLGCSLFMISPSKADNGTWNANSAGNWSDTTKWTSGTVADGADFTAAFGNVINANRIVTLDSDRTIGNLRALDTSNDYTVSGANILTLDVTTEVSALEVVAGRTLAINSPVTISDGLVKNGAGSVTFGGPVSLAADQQWTHSTTGVLTTGNAANLINNGGYQLTIENSAAINMGVINNDSPSMTGNGNLVKNGAGVLSLGGVNAGFTGNITVNAGTLRVTKPTSIGGNLNLAGGVYEHYWSDAYTRTLGTDPGQVQITGGVSGFSENGATGVTFTLNNSAAFELVWGALGEAGNAGALGLFNPSVFVLQAATAQGGSSLALANKLDLNGTTRTIFVSGGTTGLARAAITGQVRNTSGTAGIVKSGSGMLNLTSGANAWNGTTTVSGGILDLGPMTNANLGGGLGVRDVTVAAGAGVRFNALSNALLNRIVETADEITVMTGTTANSIDFSSSTGANLPGAFLGNWVSNGAKAECSGTLTPASDNYRLGGRGSNGLLGIVGANKLTGTQGLIVGGTGGSSSRVNLAAAQDFTGATTISTGARLTLGNNLALQNSALNVGATGGNFSLAAGTNAGRITGETAAPTPTFGGLIGSRNLIAVFSSSVGNNETNLGAAAVTGFTLNVAAGQTHSYSGAIGGFGVGATAGTGGNSTLTKIGDGTQILAGACTFTGTTAINGGTLALGASNVLADASSVLLGGGTLDAATYQDTAALLDVTTGVSVINFGVGATLAFTDSSAVPWTGTLNLIGFVSGSSLRFGDGTGAGLNADQLSRISAAGFGSFAVNGSGFLIASPSGGGYSAWKSANGTTQTIGQDHDGDGIPNGIEYFLRGATNSEGFNALPGPISNDEGLSITWIKDGSYAGSYGPDFVVETSSNLIGGSWTTETLGGNVTITGNSVKYTFPMPLTDRRFVRLKVTGP